MKIPPGIYAVIAALGWLIAPHAMANQYGYTWQSELGSQEFTGEIVLDAPQSPISGGLITDILSVTITENSGSPMPVTPIALEGAFTWNEDGITAMSLLASAVSGFCILDADSIIAMSAPSADIGTWAAVSVPDNTSTLPLLSSMLVTLLTTRRFYSRFQIKN